MFTSLDHTIIHSLNAGAGAVPWLDRLIVMLTNSDLVKGGAIIALFWAIWFGAKAVPERHRILLCSLLASLGALFVARVCAAVLPHRLRPVLDPAQHFRPPVGLPDQSNWTTWSSFPSDHSALFVAIIAGIWIVNRRVGIFATLYACLMIFLPRMYIGIHFPTDLLAGAALGVGATLLAIALDRGISWTRPILRAVEKFPSTTYALLFLLTFQIATLFWDVRIIMSYFGFSS